MDILKPKVPLKPSVLLALNPDSVVFNNTRVEKTAAIQTIISVEKAERLKQTAETIGGFSVDVTANAGDRYFTINDGQDGGKDVCVYAVPEDHVIVNLVNTGNPHTPGDLSPLYRAAE